MRAASFWLTTAALALLGRPASAKVASIDFADLVKESPVIAVVKVDAVVKIAGVRVARAEVLTAYAGVAAGDRLAFLAEPAWTCDASWAYQDEVALVFLAPMPDEMHWMFRGKPTHLRAAIASARAFKSLTAYQIAHSGRGRLVVETENGVELAADPGAIRFPASLVRDKRQRYPLSDVTALLH